MAIQNRHRFAKIASTITGRELTQHFLPSGRYVLTLFFLSFLAPAQVAISMYVYPSSLSPLSPVGLSPGLSQVCCSGVIGLPWGHPIIAHPHLNLRPIHRERLGGALLIAIRHENGEATLKTCDPHVG